MALPKRAWEQEKIENQKLEITNWKFEEGQLAGGVHFHSQEVA
jgi:hypothetical protein